MFWEGPGVVCVVLKRKLSCDKTFKKSNYGTPKDSKELSNFQSRLD
jgi:hypothetical protein